MMALEAAFWSEDDLKAAFDAGTDASEHDQLSLQMDIGAVGRDMRTAFGTVREGLPEDQQEVLPNPADIR